MRVAFSTRLFAFCCLAAFGAAHASAGTPEGAATDTSMHSLHLDLGSSGHILQHIVAKKVKTQNGQTGSGTTEMTYDLAYKAGSDGFSVDKTMTRFDLLELSNGGAKNGEKDPAVKAMMQAMMGGVADIHYSADDSLWPLRIDDYPALRTAVHAATADGLAKAGVPPQVVPQLSKSIDTLYAQLDEETAAAAFLSTDRFIAQVHNIDIKLHEPVQKTTQMATPFGSAVEATEGIELSDWNTETHTAHLVYDYRPAPASLKDFLSGPFIKIMTDMGAPAADVAAFQEKLKTADADSLMNISTHCDYDVDIITDMVSNGTCVKNSSFTLAGQTLVQVETTQFDEQIKKN